MAFKVETGIPHPSDGCKKYPFGEMKPGDSFLINGDASHTRVAVAALAFGKAYDRGWKFSTLKTAEGYRCWRIK